MKDLESVRAQVEILRMVKESQKKLKALEADARAAVEDAMGNHEQGSLDGQIVVTWTTHKKRQFQQAELKDAHPEVIESYTRLVEARTFKVVEAE